MPLTFINWKDNHPNVKEHNQDDCALMDCKSHDCVWLDVPCTSGVSHLSFICQKPHVEVDTWTTPVTTTPSFTGYEI